MSEGYLKKNEVVESLNRLSETGAHLVILPPEQRAGSERAS